MDKNLLRALVDLRDRTLQKSRIAFGNRVSAIQRGDDQSDPATLILIQDWEERLRALEDEADRDIAKLVEGSAIVEKMCEIRGLGRILSAKIVSMIDIHNSNTVSELWRYSGYGVVDGHREYPTKGEKIHYNKRLKTTLYLVATSFLRTNSPYRRIYDEAREYYTVNRPDWSEGHRHIAAMRKMIKVFLCHLWIKWRTLEGLPVRNLYVEEHLGHTSFLTPEEFGWS